VAAARQGLQAQFRWLGGQNYTARTLILNQLLPLARQGLRAQGVGREEVDKYLGIVHERVGTGQTGAQWVLGSLAGLGENTPREAAQHAVTAALLANQKADAPVHQWPLLQATDAEKDWASRFQTVGQIMSTDLFTVRPDDLVDLAANVMEWRHVRHVPVENDQGQIVGLVSHRTLLRLLARGLPQANLEPLAVRDVMISNPLTVTPATPTLVAMNLMRSEKVGCLPVIERGCLVGIVTAYDFLAAAAHLLEKHLDAGAHAAEA
jgi:CBS domain-containing protein